MDICAFSERTITDFYTIKTQKIIFCVTVVYFQQNCLTF
jgi:hypothetical protein